MKGMKVSRFTPDAYRSSGATWKGWEIGRCQECTKIFWCFFSFFGFKKVASKIILNISLSFMCLSIGIIWNYTSQLAIKSLVGGIPTPLKNMSSSVGMMQFPIYGKSKKNKVPNHQPDHVNMSQPCNQMLDASPRRKRGTRETPFSALRYVWGCHHHTAGFEVGFQEGLRETLRRAHPSPIPMSQCPNADRPFLGYELIHKTCTPWYKDTTCKLQDCSQHPR